MHSLCSLLRNFILTPTRMMLMQKGSSKKFSVHMRLLNLRQSLTYFVNCFIPIVNYFLLNFMRESWNLSFHRYWKTKTNGDYMIRWLFCLPCMSFLFYPWWNILVMLLMLYGLLNVSFSLIIFGITITWVKYGIKSKIFSESLSRLW